MLIRDIPGDRMAWLMAWAKRNGLPVQCEVKAIVREAAPETMTCAQAQEASARIRASLEGRTVPDATPVFREDRDQGLRGLQSPPQPAKRGR